MPVEAVSLGRQLSKIFNNAQIAILAPGVTTLPLKLIFRANCQAKVQVHA